MATSQVIVIHLSDVHFGPKHTFKADATPSGKPAPEAIKTLADSLIEEMNSFDQKYETVILVISGDLTTNGDIEQFAEATEFINRLAETEVFGTKIGKERIFIVPGNHDIQYGEKDKREFWKNYHNFHKGLFGHTKGRELKELGDERYWKVHNFTECGGFVLVEVATCHHNEKDTDDVDRGCIDQKDLHDIEIELKKVSPELLKKNIRIAVMHHHPVLIPAFAEEGRNYDAIINSGLLLKLLNDFGFQIVLHGHKHNPHGFIYDITCASEQEHEKPLFIIAGGSAASTDLPENVCNSYNLINIKHDSDKLLSRVQLVTKKLITRDKHGAKKNMFDWNWEESRMVDRTLSFDKTKHTLTAQREDFSDKHAALEEKREATKKTLRYNFPIVEVVPSLKPDQSFEARMWIEGHHKRTDIPSTVIWSAGKDFKVSTCDRNTDVSFRNTLSSKGPFLIHVKLIFSDGHEADTAIFAHWWA